MVHLNGEGMILGDVRDVVEMRLLIVQPLETV